jgi:hypothetical protein
MTVPDFFIVGSLKSGTTALCNYLRDHPEIFISRHKEPGYFANDLPSRRQIKNSDDYLKIFETSDSNIKAFGEGSAWYLYSDQAIENIRAFNPDARLIIMLRNPIDMLRSLHSQLLLYFEENEPDFQKAWKLQDRRKNGQDLPLRADLCDPQMYQYEQIGKFGRQVGRALSIFPPQQIKIILFEDFIADTKSVYQDVLDFLGTSPDGRTDFAAVNARRTYRFPKAAHLLFKLVAMFSQMRRRMGILWNTNVFPIVDKFLTMRKESDKLDPAFRAELTEIFRQDVQLLSELIDRDLSHWLTPGKDQ